MTPGEGHLQFFRHRRVEETFGDGIHLWLGLREGLYLYVLKDTDRWSPHMRMDERFEAVPIAGVPADVRRKAGQRWGAYVRNRSRRTS